MAKLKDIATEVPDKPILEVPDEIKLGATPSITDYDWPEYVLSQLEEDELFNGQPTTDGLRRIAENLLGPILESSSRLVQCPNPANEYTSAVEHSITFGCAEVGHRTFCDVADCSEKNTISTFAKYSSSTAATRAEGRALRKALRLRHTLTAEETESCVPNVSTDKINSQQIHFMNTLCGRNDIDVMKFVNSGKGKYDNINDVPYDKAGTMNRILSDYQSGKIKIPQEIVGYKSDWRPADDKA